jgi:hypothetical protein
VLVAGVPIRFCRKATEAQGGRKVRTKGGKQLIHLGQRYHRRWGQGRRLGRLMDFVVMLPATKTRKLRLASMKVHAAKVRLPRVPSDIIRGPPIKMTNDF